MLEVFQELCFLVKGFEISLHPTTKAEEYNCYLILRLQSFCYSRLWPKGLLPVFEKDFRLKTSAFVVFLHKLIGKP